MKTKSFLSLLLALTLLAGLMPPVALADDTGGDTGMKITTAQIKAEGTTDQDLTASGTFRVDFSKQFTLHIVVKSQLNLPNKKVEITVPDGLTVVEFPIPERGGMVDSVTPESLDDLNSRNHYGGYRPKNGTITYSLKNTAVENSFNIILAPDTTLWNRRNGQELTDSLTIKVYTDGTDGTAGQAYQTVSAKATITGRYANTDRALQTGPRLSTIGVKNGVPTAANTPFALRQVWVNPDKDYIDMPQFFKELEITIALPYYTKNGSNVYAELDHIEYDPAGQSTRKNMMDPENHEDTDDNFNFKQTENDNHTVTLKWTNLYLEYGQEYFTPYFMWTSDCDVTTIDAVKWYSDLIHSTGNTAPGCYEGKEPTTGSAAVGGKIIWQDDSVWHPWNYKFNTLSFTARSGEYMTVKGETNDKGIYSAHDSDPNIVYYLGQFHVVNQGGTESAAKTVEFEYNSSFRDKIGVTAQKIPATTGNPVTVQYQTTKHSDWQTYAPELISDGGFVTFTAAMAGLGKDEYFTAIKADVGSYARDYVGYVSTRSSDPTSGYATTFGKLLTAGTGTYSSFASMSMKNTDDSGSAITTAYNVSVTNSRGEIPLAMEQAYKENSLERLPILSKTSATAGDTITFNGLLSSSAYPYSSNNIMTDPEIYLRLPEKITVKSLTLYQEVGRMADKVFLSDLVTETVESPQRRYLTKDTDYKFEPVSTATTAADDTTTTGYKLYKITFTGRNNPVKVGWFADGLGQYQIGLSFDMEIAKDADAMTLDMRDCVRFKSASLSSTSNTGTLGQYQVKDPNNVYMQGTDTRMSTFNVNAKGTKLSVVAARLGLTFTFGAKVVEKGAGADYDPTSYSNFEVDRQKVYLKDATHVVDMLFTLKNETGRAFSEQDAKAFYYFIPVPKNGDIWDNHMQSQAFEFDMNLTRAPTITGNAETDILVTYATEIDSKAAAGTETHYSNTAQYKTEAELLAGCDTDQEKAAKWKAVKMIRIAAKNGVTSIAQDASLAVNMRLEPSFKENAELVGSEINFGPCGVSPYSVGNTLNQGHNPLPRIQVEFQTGIIAGKFFLDKNFNGRFDDGDEALYKDGVNGILVATSHTNGTHDPEEIQELTEKTETFEFVHRRADTYHVTVTTPGSTNANGTNPLKFSLPETGGNFRVGDDSTTATATVVLDMNQENNDIDAAQNLMIGFQQPHTVTFAVEHATLASDSTKVWHGDELGNVVPEVTADSGWKFTGNWTVGDESFTTEALKTKTIDADTTFTAEVKQLYSVSYNPNGGTGAVPETTWHIEGEKVKPDYTGTRSLTNGEKTIFVGWSETPITKVLSENAATEDAEAIANIISSDEHTMPDRDVTLYAVYAVDANDNDYPDYNDEAVHVRYHGNNNVRTDVLCAHHHVVGAKETLSTSGTVSGRTLEHGADASAATGDVTSFTFTYGTNIFIGWSTTPILDTVIETNARYLELKDSIKTEVTMLAKPGDTVSAEAAKDTSQYADADGNTNVYAVWAADRNGNNTADYLEEHTLTYNGNAQQSGAVTGTPTDAKIYIPYDKATLTGTPTHSDVDSKKVVFIGWTANPTSSIYARADDAPNTITKVTFGTGDKTVYAAWGYDENDDGTADVLETYTLTYNLNGGKETVPTAVTGIVKSSEVTLTTAKYFTRNDKEIFVGWSTTQRTDALTLQDKQEDVNKFLITGATYRIGTADVTLYAVWAANRNGNNTADYLEARRLNYAANPCSGTVVSDTMPADNTIYVPNETPTLSTAAPTHSNVDNKKVIFTGWTASATDKIHSRTDTAPTILTEVTFGGTDITVYAAWAYDENANGTADYQETRTLTYEGNANGGTVNNLPTDGNKYIPKDTVNLSGQKPTHSNVDGKKVVFIGWTETATDKIHSRTDAAPTTITEVTFDGTDIIVYAAWAYVENTSDPSIVEKTRHSAYIMGYTDGAFGPECNMNRAEAAAIFARLLAEEKGNQLTETGSSATGYTDVPATAWYAEYVKYLDHYGIIYGRGEQRFAPDDKITRAEFTAMVVRFFEACGKDVGIQGEHTGFIDMAPGHWATEYIQCAAAQGWIKGYGDGTFRAERDITRAEAVTLVNKMLGRSADTMYVTNHFHSLNTFADVSDQHWAYMEIMEAANTHLTTPGKPENWSK